MILVSTEAGDVFKYDRTGRRLLAMSVEGAISDMKSYLSKNAEDDIVLTTRDGGLLSPTILCYPALQETWEALLFLASLWVGNQKTRRFSMRLAISDFHGVIPPLLFEKIEAVLKDRH